MPPVSSDPAPASFDHSILITAAPTRVLGAFFDPRRARGVVADEPDPSRPRARSASTPSNGIPPPTRTTSWAGSAASSTES